MEILTDVLRYYRCRCGAPVEEEGMLCITCFKKERKRLSRERRADRQRKRLAKEDRMIEAESYDVYIMERGL